MHLFFPKENWAIKGRINQKSDAQYQYHQLQQTEFCSDAFHCHHACIKFYFHQYLPG
jgi:hypothetical protein